LPEAGDKDGMGREGILIKRYNVSVRLEEYILMTCFHIVTPPIVIHSGAQNF
jgi:hypothetical protein